MTHEQAITIAHVTVGGEHVAVSEIDTYAIHATNGNSGWLINADGTYLESGHEPSA